MTAFDRLAALRGAAAGRAKSYVIIGPFRYRDTDERIGPGR